MTETIVIIRNRLTAKDFIEIMLDDVKAEAIIVYIVDAAGERHKIEDFTVEIDVINPADLSPRIAEVATPELERMVSDERKAELDGHGDPAVDEEDLSVDDMPAADGGDDQDAGTVTEESDPARGEEASGEGSAGKRYFYNADDDKLIVTADGSVPGVMEDEETAGDWTELETGEGEEIEAELAKQGDLLGGSQADNAEKRPQEPKGERQEEKAGKEPEKGSSPKGGKLAQMAGILSNEGAFWKYLSEGGGGEITNAEEAADAIRNTCGVASRAELDTNKSAGHEFKMMERSYRAWLNT